METKIDFTPALILHQHTIQYCNLYDLLEKMGEMRKIIKDAVGYKWDNHHFYIKSFIGGRLFSFLLHENSTTFTLSIWDSSGNRALGTITVNKADLQDGKMPKESYTLLENLLNMYVSGNIACSKCGKIIKQEDIAGRYFAGVYCTDCWEGGVKEQERRQNYD